jgi:hypothetical protein
VGFKIYLGDVPKEVNGAYENYLQQKVLEFGLMMELDVSTLVRLHFHMFSHMYGLHIGVRFGFKSFA